MTTFIFANNAGSTLAGAINNTTTTLNLAAGGGALFPNPTAGQQFAITAIDAATGLLREIMYCTARSVDTLTVVRAQESTTGLNWNPGDFIQELWTAGQCAAMVQAGTLPTTSLYYGADTGAVNAMVATFSPTLSALVTGIILEVTPLYANTSTSVTLNPSTLGVTNVKRADGTALVIGDIQPAPYKALLAYDGASSSFVLLNPCLWVSMQLKAPLAGAATYYVNPATGSDSYDGQSATVTGGHGPWATLNHAWTFLQQNINANAQNITINCGFSGATAYAAFAPTGGITGVFSASQVSIVGDVSNQNCQISVSAVSSSAVLASSLALYTMSGFKLTSTNTGGAGITVSGGAQVVISSMSFGACGAYAAQAQSPGSQLTLSGTNNFLGNCISIIHASQSGLVHIDGSTVLNGGITVTYTISANDAAGITATGVTFGGSGIASGAKFSIAGGAYLDCAGSQPTVSTNYIPGPSNGSAGSGNFTGFFQ